MAAVCGYPEKKMFDGAQSPRLRKEIGSVALKLQSSFRLKCRGIPQFLHWRRASLGDFS